MFSWEYVTSENCWHPTTTMYRRVDKAIFEFREATRMYYTVLVFIYYYKHLQYIYDGTTYRYSVKRFYSSFCRQTNPSAGPWMTSFKYVRIWLLVRGDIRVECSIRTPGSLTCQMLNNIAESKCFSIFLKNLKSLYIQQFKAWIMEPNGFNHKNLERKTSKTWLAYDTNVCTNSKSN